MEGLTRPVRDLENWPIDAAYHQGLVWPWLVVGAPTRAWSVAVALRVLVRIGEL